MSPVLCLVTDDTDDATAALIAKREVSLDEQHERAVEAGIAPDVVADLDDEVTRALGRLAKNPGTPLRAILFDLGRAMYVAGRMDQAQDDETATAQAEALVDGALAQVADLVERRARKDAS